MRRVDVTFPSGDSWCAGWLYEPDNSSPPSAAGNSACVVMAHGFSLTRRDGLEQYAERFAATGSTVLLFDHRHLGESGGDRRQRIRIGEQKQDYRSAVAFARERTGINPDRIMLWGFSFSGGTAVTVAADDRRIAGAVLTCPMLDARQRALDAARASPRTMPWLIARAIADTVGRPAMIPVTGPSGSRAAMALAGEVEGFQACLGSESLWRNEVAPGGLLQAGGYRPVRLAKSLRCPVWVGLGERDISAPRSAIEQFVRDAPQAELHRYDADHFEPCYAEMAHRIADDQAQWIARIIGGDQPSIPVR